MEPSARDDQQVTGPEAHSQRTSFRKERKSPSGNAKHIATKHTTKTERTQRRRARVYIDQLGLVIRAYLPLQIGVFNVQILVAVKCLVDVKSRGDIEVLGLLRWVEPNLLFAYNVCE